MQSRYYFGIDLGTTNSVISVYDDAKKTNVSIDLGNGTLLKSAISLSDKNELLVGNINPDGTTIKDVKSLMGEQAQIEMSLSEEYRLDPIQVSSLILKELKERAEKYFDNEFEIKDITITVPAKFDHLRRSNTVKAAMMAGLNVVSLINEPTAASLAYIEDVQKQETVLVYDLGGGTFDASIVSISPSVEALNLPALGIKTKPITNKIVTVICSDGDINLGGNDLDAEIIRSACEEQRLPMSLMLDKSLLKLAQEVKEKSLVVKSWEKDYNGREVVLGEDNYKEATRAIYARTKKIIDNLLATHSSITIDKIIMVGGSTKNDYLKLLLKDDFPKLRIYSDINPDECVSLGAAKNTYICMNSESTTKFYDVCSDTVGLEIRDVNILRFEKMIYKGTALPCKYTRNFVRTSAKQKEIRVPVYQGDNNNCQYNTPIGELSIQDIPETITIEEPIHCTFSMDKNGILTVTVKFSEEVREVKIDSKASVEDNSENKKMFNKLESILESDEF